MTNTRKQPYGDQPAGPEVDVDVVIVGSGPSGMVAASILGRHWRVAVIERHPVPYGLPRAGSIDHEILRILQGIEAHQPLLDDGVVLPEYRWVNGQGEILFAFSPETYVSQSGFPWGVMMYQPVLEDAVRASMARCGRNVQVFMGWNAVKLEQDGSSVSVLMQAQDEEGDLRECRVTGTYLLGADGARSTVRESLGLTRTDIGFSEDWLDVDLKLLRPLERDIDGQFCDPKRPTYVGSLGKRHHRFEFALLPGESWSDLERPEKAWELIEPHGITAEDMEIVRQVVYRFEAKVADTWRSGRAFLLGDAAHTMPPHLGMGLCSGVRDAANISWKLDLVLRGEADDSLLDEYERERRPNAEQWVADSVRVGRISCTLDAAEAAERDARLLAGDIPAVVPAPISEGVLQRDPQGEVREPVGRLALQATVSDGSTSGLLHDVVGQGFILLGRNIHASQLRDPEVESVLHRFDVTVGAFDLQDPSDRAISLTDVDHAYADFFDAHDVDAIVIRPDYFVFGVAKRGSGVAEVLRDLSASIAPGRALAEVGPAATHGVGA